MGSEELGSFFRSGTFGVESASLQYERGQWSVFTVNGMSRYMGLLEDI